MWKIVPTFGIKKEQESESLNSSNLLDSIFLANVKFVIFTFSLFLFVDTINAPVLRQYAKVGFNVGIEIAQIILVFVFLFLSFLFSRFVFSKREDWVLFISASFIAKHPKTIN